MELANSKKNTFFSSGNSYDNRYCTEDFNADKDKATSNVFLLSEQVKENSKVLDVACGSGKFSEILNKKNCEVFGIDIDEEAMKHAKGYKKLLSVNMIDYKSELFLDFMGEKGSWDVIIMSDILEHLEYPTEAIMFYSQYINKNGQLLISIPNIANADIPINLLSGRFNYAQMGILDNTHLKFFTKSSFLEWIEQINTVLTEYKLDCTYLGATVYKSDYIKDMEKEYPELFKIISQYENHAALQILFSLKKIDKKQIPASLNEELEASTSLDIGESIGKALKGTLEKVNIAEPSQGEFFQFKKQSEEIEEALRSHIKDLEDGIEWHNKNKDEIEKILRDTQNYASELRKNVDWHEENSRQLLESHRQIQVGYKQSEDYNKQMKEYSEQMEEYIENLKSGIEWHEENIGHSENHANLMTIYSKELEKRIDTLLKKQRVLEKEKEFLLSKVSRRVRKNIENI